MEHQQQYKELLANNNATNNLLVLNLLQSQENWSKEEALIWIFQTVIPTFQTLPQEHLFYFGRVSLSFIFHHAILNDSLPTSNPKNLETDHLYKAVLMCRAQNQTQSKLLYKIAYIEEASNLLEMYKQYLLEHLEQIIHTFVVEIIQN